jgi:hypothetical protein
MAGKFTREDCIKLLYEKRQNLLSQGEERFPQRNDFSPEEVVAIKAFLGPWPRALEAAGIKEPPPFDRKAKNTEKRIRAKRKRIEELKAKGKNSTEI